MSLLVFTFLLGSESRSCAASIKLELSMAEDT